MASTRHFADTEACFRGTGGIILAMKRYAVFSYEHYYPGGGWNDFENSFDTVDEARDFKVLPSSEYKQIIDLQTGEEIENPGTGYGSGVASRREEQKRHERVGGA